MNLVKEINWGWLQVAIWKRESSKDHSGSGGWIRIFGKGFSVTNGMKLFSERNGYQKSLKLPCGYRARILKNYKFD